MIKKILIATAVVFAIVPAVIAQVNDAQIWENVNVEKTINPKFSVRINQEGRITDNCSHFSFNYFDFGANYKLSKHIHATLAYVWVEKQRLDETWSARHQAYLDFVFRGKLLGFVVSDRQMFLWQVKDYFSSANGRIPDYYLRNKLMIRWDKTFKFQPYVAEETYYRCYGPGEPVPYHFNRMRYFAGIFYHPDAKNELEAYYLIEHHFNINDPPTNWVIGLGYAYSF